MDTYTVYCTRQKECNRRDTATLIIVCSRSVGRGLRAEVYVMVECSYFAVDGMPIEMYVESWIAGLLTSDDVMLYMAGFGTT